MGLLCRDLAGLVAKVLELPRGVVRLEALEESLQLPELLRPPLAFRLGEDRLAPEEKTVLDRLLGFEDSLDGLRGFGDERLGRLVPGGRLHKQSVDQSE